MDAFSAAQEAAATVAVDAYEKAVLGEFSDIGQVEQYMATAMKGFFDQYGPQLAEQMKEMIKPATEKAMEIVKPAIDKALKDYTPTFAGIVGGMLAMSVLLGVYVAKKTYQRTR